MGNKDSQKDCEFKASLGCIGLKNPKTPQPNKQKQRQTKESKLRRLQLIQFHHMTFKTVK
jgi:hypothetical protein